MTLEVEKKSVCEAKSFTNTLFLNVKNKHQCTHTHNFNLPCCFSLTLYSLSVSRIKKTAPQKKARLFLEYTLAMSFNDYNSPRKKIQFYTSVQMRPGKVGMFINTPSSLLLLKGGPEARWLEFYPTSRENKELFFHIN